ncbi:MAG: hypothetical protein ABSA94_01735 [Acidobacteriaceae bacterium]|jgi:hypothetical protein
MTLFDLLFILLFLASAVVVVSLLVLLVRGRGSAAKRLFWIFAGTWVAYLAIVFVSAAATPQRIVPMSQDQCFDEMCFAVAQAQTASQLGPPSDPVTARGIFYVVTVRVTSHSRGRTQSEGGLHALLWNSGTYYQVSARGQNAWQATHPATPALTARLHPGETVLSDQVFEVPATASSLGLVLSHGFTPAYFVIGECPLFHPPDILHLQQ